MSSRDRELTDRGHDKFVELCAVYTSGLLSVAEQIELNAHLAGCDECRMLLADYRHLIQDTIPLLADEANVAEVDGFHEELATTRRHLFSALTPADAPRQVAMKFRRGHIWGGRV